MQAELLHLIHHFPLWLSHADVMSAQHGGAVSFVGISFCSLGLVLGTEAPVVTSNGVDFSFFSQLLAFAYSAKLTVVQCDPLEPVLAGGL